MTTLLLNGKILQPGGTFCEALCIENQRITHVGNNEEISQFKTASSTIIDAQGKLVLPGFNDSHLHFFALGAFLSSVNCYGLTSIEAIINQGKEFLRNHPSKENQAVIGMGWNQDYFIDEKRLLNRHDLDKISTTVPLIFKRTCIHVAVCNTKALELAKITKDTPQVEGGTFEVDEHGHPTGVFNENAQSLLECLEPKVTLEQVKEYLLTATNHALCHGLTSVQVGDLSQNRPEFSLIIPAYKQLIQEGKIPIRINLQCCFFDPTSFQKFIDLGYSTGYGDDHFKIGPLKLFVDGSLGARTALMRQPYKDNPETNGIACLSQDQLNGLVSLANTNKFQVLVHAIGDEAIHRVLTSYESLGNSRNPLRHAINHCQITDFNLLKRFQQSNILALVQPIFLHYDLHIVEDRVGKELASSSYAFNTMEKLGLSIAYGTDAPVEDLNPFNCISCAVTRKDLNDHPTQGFYPEESVSALTAIERYTLGGAYASFEENIKGSLEVGKVADLIILDQDLFTISPEQIKDTSVSLTMIDGKVVYQQS